MADKRNRAFIFGNAAGTASVRAAIDDKISFAYCCAVIASITFGCCGKLRNNACLADREWREFFIGNFLFTFF